MQTTKLKNIMISKTPSGKPLLQATLETPNKELIVQNFRPAGARRYAEYLMYVLNLIIAREKK